MSTKQTEDTNTKDQKIDAPSAFWSVVGLLCLAMVPVSYLLGLEEQIITFLAPDVSLARPKLLLWLWAVPGLALLLSQRRKLARQKLYKLIAPHLAARMTPSHSPTKRRLKLVLLAAAWTMFLLTWAGPQWGTQVRILQRKGIDIIVAIDLSESMLAKDIQTANGTIRRLALARKKVRVLMDMLAGERVGIIAFAGRPVTLCPLTIDHNTCAIWLNSFEPSLIAQGGTALATSIKHAIPMFATSGANSRALILLTDGDDHEKNTKKAAAAAKKKGIHIYALGFGSTKMSTIPPEQLPPPPRGEPADPRPIRTRLNQALLQNIVTSTSGQYQKATISHRDIRALVDHARTTLRAQTHKSQRVVFREERFAMFMGIGLLLLLLQWGIGERKTT